MREVNYQDFQIVKRMTEKAIEDYGQEYFFNQNGIGFVWTILENYFGLSEDEISEAITDASYQQQKKDSGGDDSGIDAIIIDNENFHVKLINCKYTENYEKAQKNFPSNETHKIVAFLNLLFTKQENISILNQKLNEKIQEIIEMMKREKVSIEIFFVGNCSDGLTKDYKEKFNYDLKTLGYDRYVKHGFIGVDEIANHYCKRNDKINAKFKTIDNHFFEKSGSGIRAFIAEIYAKDIVRIVSNNEDLRNDIDADLLQIRSSEIDEMAFDENVRIYLRQRTSINKGIKKSATDENESSNFFFYNNGITITCDHFDYQGKRNATVLLDNLQIVNGGQTVHSLKEALQDERCCDNVEEVALLCRIYETRDQELKIKIAEYTNSQNPVKSRDLRSLDSIQTRLEANLKLEGYFYERKKNQYKDKPRDKRLDAEKIGQILYAKNGYPSEAKNKKSLIFGSAYETIFYDTLTVQEILKTYKTYRFIELNKEIKKQDFSFLKYATYYVLYAFCLFYGDIEIDDEKYEYIVQIINSIVEDERKQNSNFLESVFFKEKKLKNILDKKISELKEFC